MSQILIYWTRGENTAFLNKSSKHFRCVTLRFPISILWEFNLIPTDISPGTVFQKKNNKIGNKKIRTDWRWFFSWFNSTRVFGYLSPFLSASLSRCLSVHFYRDYFILFARVLAVLATGLRGLLWTNPPQSCNNLSVHPQPTLLPPPLPLPIQVPLTIHKDTRMWKKCRGPKERAVWG